MQKDWILCFYNVVSDINIATVNRAKSVIPNSTLTDVPPSLLFSRCLSLLALSHPSISIAKLPPFILHSPGHLLPWPTGQWAKTQAVIAQHTHTHAHTHKNQFCSCLTHWAELLWIKKTPVQAYILSIITLNSAFLHQSVADTSSHWFTCKGEPPRSKLHLHSVICSLTWSDIQKKFTYKTHFSAPPPPSSSVLPPHQLQIIQNLTVCNPHPIFSFWR